MLVVVFDKVYICGVRQKLSGTMNASFPLCSSGNDETPESRL